MRRAVARALFAPALGLFVAITLAAQQTQGFPHEKHAKLFPDCAGCHAGILNGDAATAIPSPTVCAQCHNGTDVKRIDWSGYLRPPTNLRFSHTRHAEVSQAKGTPATCQSCHSSDAESEWMQVKRPEPVACLSCHKAPEHLADAAVCQTCHVRLTEATMLTASVIADFPKPASHSRSDFPSAHAPKTDADVARCATCHARESCARCHANASKVPAIMALGSDGRVAQLMAGRKAAYATPTNHTAANWSLLHGQIAAERVGSCANCHTQPSCQTCHTGSKGASTLAQLPPAAKPGASAIGVVLQRARADTGLAFTADPPRRDTAVVRVHPPGFATSHKTTAASGRLDCQGCHQSRECETCHEGASSKRYHPVDFSARHAPAAYGQDQQCSTCHRTETFCRSCHVNNGVTVLGATKGAVHTGQPAWLLQHGQAARQGMVGCTTCHQQRDCLRCHSSVGLKVNPHGPAFDAKAMYSRNRTMCFTCHLTDPTK